MFMSVCYGSCFFLVSDRKCQLALSAASAQESDTFFLLMFCFYFQEVTLLYVSISLLWQRADCNKHESLRWSPRQMRMEAPSPEQDMSLHS